MNRTLKFSGHSDDIFEVEDSDSKLNNEYSIGFNSSGDAFASKLLISSNEGQMVVIGTYSRHEAGWDIAICLAGEDIPLPAWGIRMFSKSYSPVLEIDIPDRGVLISELVNG